MIMNKNHIKEFYDKLCELQDEYGIYIEADYNEDWDYAWDGENEYPTLADVNAYVSFVNEKGYEVARLVGSEIDMMQEGIVMNNLEWLYENDRDTLLTMVDGDCDCCKFDSYCEQGDYRCDRNWLEVEYGEPDSWEKIERDCKIDSWHYCQRYGLETQWIEDDCLPLESAPIRMKKHLVSRCKALAGAE